MGTAWLARDLVRGVGGWVGGEAKCDTLAYRPSLDLSERAGGGVSCGPCTLVMWHLHFGCAQPGLCMRTPPLCLPPRPPPCAVWPAASGRRSPRIRLTHTSATCSGLTATSRTCTCSTRATRQVGQPCNSRAANAHACANGCLLDWRLLYSTSAFWIPQPASRHPNLPPL